MSNMQTGLDPQSIPGFTLWQLSKLWQRTLTMALQPFGVGSTEFVLLANAVRLRQLGQDTTQPALTEMTKIDRMTVSQTARSLAKKGLVSRESLLQNKRVYRIVPTSEGVRLTDEALGVVIRAHSYFFAPLSDRTGDFLAHMHTLLQNNK